MATLAMTTGAAAASVKRSGKILVNSGESVQCPAGGVPCTVTARAMGRDARNRSVTLGSTTITVAPAATASLIFELDGLGKHLLLARGPLQATLTVTLSDGAGAPIVTTHTITIGVPRRHRGRR